MQFPAHFLIRDLYTLCHESFAKFLIKMPIHCGRCSKKVRTSAMAVESLSYDKYILVLHATSFAYVTFTRPAVTRHIARTAQICILYDSAPRLTIAMRT